MPHAVASEQATLNNAPRGVLITDTRLPHRRPSASSYAAPSPWSRWNLNLPGGALTDILSGSHLLHRAAQADVLIELAPGTTYTGERRYTTTAFASPIAKRNARIVPCPIDKEY